MKSALEALQETAQKEYDYKLQCESEQSKLWKKSDEYSNLWCNGYIQQAIDSAIQNRKTSTSVEIMEDSVRAPIQNVSYKCWKMLPLQSHKRGTWNGNARGYYQVPTEEGFIFNLDKVTENLETAGYTVNIVPDAIYRATTKTGKCGYASAIRKINISWNPVSL